MAKTVKKVAKKSEKAAPKKKAPVKKAAKKKTVKEVPEKVEEVVEEITKPDCPEEEPLGETEFAEFTIKEIMVQKNVTRTEAIEILRNPK